MHPELKSQTLVLMTKHPTWSDQKVADELNLSRSSVWRIRTKNAVRVDLEYSKTVGSRLLADFDWAANYLKLKIDELEELKSMKKTVFHKGENGGSFTSDEALEPLDLLAINREQRSCATDLITMARQGEAIEVIKALKRGEIEFKPSS